MKSIFENFGSENHPKALILKRSLDEFYKTVEDYSAYLESDPKPFFWNPIRSAIEEHLKTNNYCHVLEFGAGRTSFGTYLGDLRSRVVFHAQDITDRNRDYLESQADQVYICNIPEIQEKYDIIFSTFVWEHLVTPSSIMEHLLKILNPNGKIFITSPRYDLPFYISPSAKHLPIVKRLQISVWLMFRRMASFIKRKPDFIIHFDPAIFHCPWFRDADAIHWVSFCDLKYYLPDQFKLTRIRIPVTDLRSKIWGSLCLLFVKI
ncbi:class I SAM-dependent methyltransferase [Trichothermofontia sp.]